MCRVLVYGSLRVGMYNYERFKNYFGDNFKYKDTIKISGYALYSRKNLPYPFAVRTKNNNDIIEVDIMECSTECKDSLDQMEFGAGYKADILNNNSTIYVYDQPPFDTNKIESGNWLTHVKENDIPV